MAYNSKQTNKKTKKPTNSIPGCFCNLIDIWEWHHTGSRMNTPATEQTETLCRSGKSGEWKENTWLEKKVRIINLLLSQYLFKVVIQSLWTEISIRFIIFWWWWTENYILCQINFFPNVFQHVPLPIYSGLKTNVVVCLHRAWVSVKLCCAQYLAGGSVTRVKPQ